MSCRSSKCPKLACALCWKTSLHELSRTGDALNRGFGTYIEAHNLLWDFRVEYPDTWLQRLSPADVSTAELALVECELAANKD